MVSSKPNSALVGFYRWLEKQRSVGTKLTAAYVNHHKTTTHSISHSIKWIGSELSTEINRVDN